MRRFSLGAAVIFLALLALQASAPAFTASPPYATAGAHASYTAEGGFIPYFSGVQGNLTYSVIDVFGNGSMAVRVFINITAGTELNPFVSTINVTDNVATPGTFPAVSIASLSTRHVLFENVSASFVKNDTISVPAGKFDAMEFAGVGANNTATRFWFDPATGLMLEASAGTSAIQLDSSNIAVAAGPPAGFNGEVPYEVVFVVAFAVGGSLFLYMRHHYTSTAAKSKKVPVPAKKK